MSVELFYDPASFERLAGGLLEQTEALNNLPLGILAVLKRRPEIARTALMLAGQSESGHLFAIRTPPQHLVLAQTEGALDLIPDLVHWLIANEAQHVPFSGLVAPLDLALAFQREWQNAGQPVLQVEMEERIYSLTQVQAPKWPPGIYRRSQIGDFGTLLTWVEAFLVEALPNEKHAIEQLRQKTLAQIEAGDLSVWVVEDRLVSMASRTRPTRHGQAITLVYTPPEQRGKGYARACVAALSQELLDHGRQFCCLFTDLANPASNRIYQQIGYRAIGDVLMLRTKVTSHES